MDGLNGLGHRLLSKGYGSPFLACGLSYMYRCLADARLDMTRTGQVIMDDGLPRQFGPMIFVFTGAGNVTKVNFISQFVPIIFLITWPLEGSSTRFQMFAS